MSWRRMIRPVLVVAGMGVVIGSILGSRALNNGSSGDPKAEPPRVTGGPVVLGWVDTDPRPVEYGLSPVLQSGRVVKVSVKDGDEVKTGQELYAFDDTIQKANVKTAAAAVKYAEAKVEEAKQGVHLHKINIEDMKGAVAIAQRARDNAVRHHDLVKQRLEEVYRAEGKAEAKWPELLLSSPDYFQARAGYEKSLSEWELAKAKLARLETVDPEVKVEEAKAAVEQAKAKQDEAQAAVDLCVVRAKTAGTVEQVSISPGATIGVGTRTPALWIIPAGPRVVRAEVEAEFAHRLGPDLKGKTVTIHDHSDAKLTYTGTVNRISASFLPKRSAMDNPFGGGETRVIEVVVEVTDPNPPGKPPLLVGKRVRVNLGQ